MPCSCVRFLVCLFPIQPCAYPDDICREVVRVNEIISLGPVLNMGPKRRGLTKGSPSKSEPGAGSAKSKVSCLFDPFLFAVFVSQALDYQTLFFSSCSSLLWATASRGGAGGKKTTPWWRSPTGRLAMRRLDLIRGLLEFEFLSLTTSCSARTRQWGRRGGRWRSSKHLRRRRPRGRSWQTSWRLTRFLLRMPQTLSIAYYLIKLLMIH